MSGKGKRRRYIYRHPINTHGVNRNGGGGGLRPQEPVLQNHNIDDFLTFVFYRYFLLLEQGDSLVVIFS